MRELRRRGMAVDDSAHGGEVKQAIVCCKVDCVTARGRLSGAATGRLDRVIHPTILTIMASRIARHENFRTDSLVRHQSQTEIGLELEITNICQIMWHGIMTYEVIEDD